MKKIFFSILVLFLLSGSCVLRPDFNMDFNLNTYTCDMSRYDGLHAVGHNFKGVTVKELEKTINEKGYGAFVLSRVGCSHCQIVMQYLNQAASELGVYVYYIDAESDKYPIVDTYNYELLDRILKPIEEVLDGEVCLQTPHFFTVIRGQFVDSYVGADFIDNDNPSDKEISNLINKYKKALEVFVNE